MSEKNFAKSTRRDFLGTATIATASALTGPVLSEATERHRHPSGGYQSGASDSWGQPGANGAGENRRLDKAGGHGDPKGGIFPTRAGAIRPIFPKTPANYGFTIIAKIKSGREESNTRIRKENRGRNSR